MRLRFHVSRDRQDGCGGSWGVRIGVVVAVVVWISPAVWADDLADPTRLTVATFNAENMLDIFDDPYSRDEKTRVKPRLEVEQVAAAIRATRADVVALQEVEHEGMLRVMVHDLLADAGYEQIVVMPTNSDHGANLGVISRYPILSLTSHRMMDLTLPSHPRVWRFARDLLRVKIQITPSRTLDLFIVHFKNGSDPDSVHWRLAEADATQRIIRNALAQDPAAWVLLAGDCNDTPDSAALDTLLRTKQGQAPMLMDVHALLSADQRATHLGSPSRGAIDYLLASPTMAQQLAPGSAGVITHPNHSPGPGSDHAPIVATFLLSETP